MRALGLTAMGAVLALAGCVNVETTNNRLVQMAPQGAVVETLPAAELASLMAAGKVVLIDVRTPKEYESGRLAGALNAPVGSFDAASIPRDPTRETILYCRSSGRSKRAADMLAAQWNSKVRHLEGGIIAWNAAELPVSKP